MTDNELHLINFIRDCNNQEEAIITAVSIITSFLARERSSVGQAPAYPPEPA